MVHNSKVLTVSYGTFSCTLEGFDDSFGTMKAIAEYFRDLASDDRYFGAEPPQPDAELLARIARREIDRQVEAHSTDSGAIVLRATDAEASQIAAPADVPAPEAKPEPTPEITPEIIAEPVQEPEVVEVAETQAQPQEADVEADEIAEVEAIEPVVGDVAQPGPGSPETADDASAEIEPAQDDSQEESKDSIAPDATPEPVETAAPAPELVHELPVAEDVQAPETVPAADSIAAKLQRIRAVVSQNDAFAPSDDYTEDEDADGDVVTQLPDLAEALKGDDDGQPDAVETKADDAADASVDDTDDEFFAKQAQDDGSDMFDDEVEEDQATGDVVNIVADDAGEQSDAPVQARVVKVKSADLEAAIASGQLEQIDDAGDDSPAASAEPQEDSTLSPEEEADLMRELAEVEDELAADQDDPEAADNIFGQDIASEVASEADEELERDDAAHAVLSNVVEDDEADLSRLMDAADEKLDDPETSTSRETYSQLRGAVAAAEAEKSAGGSVDGQTQDDAYRDDLASVVRPRRPAMSGDRTSRRAEDSRPAPLKLVAEQRIDQGVGVSQRGPVRPRRVMTTPTTPANLSDATGADSAFAEFAERVGASELPELLEAAAAYLSFVEGQDKFSRPQLMNKVRLVKQDDFNREDGLRSFGQLLRDGKIEKRGGGRFAASGDIGFRPDEREAS